MNEHPWHLPSKIKGSVRPNVTSRPDPLLVKAIRLVAKREEARLGPDSPKLSYETMIFNLMQRDSVFFREKRAEVRRTYKQLNKELNNAKSNGPSKESQAAQEALAEQVQQEWPSEDQQGHASPHSSRQRS